MATVLIIDDNPAVCTALDVLLSIDGIDTLSAGTPAEGLQKLADQKVDLVIQDMNFSEDTTSGQEGIDLFNRIREHDKDLPIILLTAWTHLETAVDLVKLGAADYLAKPWDDAKLKTTIRNLLRLRNLATENRRLQSSRQQQKSRLAEKYDLCGIVYASDAMHELLTIATRIAESDVPVLVTGPNGVGKEMLADIVQANSAVRDAAYVKVNIAALPNDLMESELFGADAGAFTGAAKARAGRFEKADGGTLFIDEVGNLPRDGQVKLLRVLQTGEFERLGSTQTRKTKARIISATNSDLKEMIRKGNFREDLYYRLNVIELNVPPLAERKDDILPLANSFLDNGYELDESARRAMLAYDWPGNVRELQNRVRRGMLLAEGKVVSVDHLDLGEDLSSLAVPGNTLDAEQIRQALARAGGVVANAARELGLSRQALYRRMEKFGIEKPR